jgi:hypothetical protein
VEEVYERRKKEKGLKEKRERDEETYKLPSALTCFNSQNFHDYLLFHDYLQLVLF